MSDARAFILGVRSQALLAHAIAAAASLGVADELVDGPLPIDDLARRCGAVPDALRRLLRALAGHGLFAENDAGEFTMTPGAEPLCRSAKGSLYPVLAGAFPALVWGAYRELETAVRTGDVAFELAHGAGFFDYLAANAAANQSFDAAMAMVAAAEHPVIAEHFEFERFPLIADVGGGRGGLLAAVLGRYPDSRGLLFDQPQVIASPSALEEAGLLNRCELAAGSFFEAVPAQADLYLLKRILHDWDDAAALRILRTVAKAMRPGARLLIIDAVMLPGNAPDPNKDLDLNMMALTGGRERSEADFRALLNAAGLELATIHALQEPVTLSIVEAALQ